MPFDFRPALEDAVRIYGGQAAGLFTTDAFGEAIRLRFDLRHAPDGAWCEGVIRGCRLAVRFKQYDFWRLADAASPGG